MLTIRLFPYRGLLAVSSIVLLAFIHAGQASANPLVGLWKPAAEQPNEAIAPMVDRLGQLEITPTHLEAFGEAPVTYTYEQDGQVFRISADAPNATPVDFVLQSQNTLLTRFPNNMDVLWQRADTAAAETTVAEAPAAGGAAGNLASEMTAGFIMMAMPHSQPTRYEALDQSLEVLLNDGWSITHASGAGAAMALVLARGNEHVVCMLMGNLQDGLTARSDCRQIN